MGYVHPYPDGNGRMARFLMNAMLAAGSYPWTVVRVEDRTPISQGLRPPVWTWTSGRLPRTWRSRCNGQWRRRHRPPSFMDAPPLPPHTTWRYQRHGSAAGRPSSRNASGAQPQKQKTEVEIGAKNLDRMTRLGVLISSASRDKPQGKENGALRVIHTTPPRAWRRRRASLHRCRQP